MNLEPMSQVCFVTRFVVAPSQTARAVYATLPHGAPYADRLADVLCSGHLLAQLESVCMDAVRAHIDWAHETLLGVSMRLEHCGPAEAGETVEVHGFVASIGDRSLQFELEARVGTRPVASGRVCFAVVPRVRLLRAAHERRAATRPAGEALAAVA